MVRVLDISIWWKFSGRVEGGDAVFWAWGSWLLLWVGNRCLYRRANEFLLAIFNFFFFSFEFFCFVVYFGERMAAVILMVLSINSVFPWQGRGRKYIIQKKSAAETVCPLDWLFTLSKDLFNLINTRPTQTLTIGDAKNSLLFNNEKILKIDLNCVI